MVHTHFHALACSAHGASGVTGVHNVDFLGILVEIEHVGSASDSVHVLFFVIIVFCILGLGRLKNLEKGRFVGRLVFSHVLNVLLMLRFF